MKCTKKARKACDDRAKKAFAEAGGDVKELRKAKAEAAQEDLKNSMEACLDGFLESPDADQEQKLLTSEACKRLGCSDAEDKDKALQGAANQLCKAKAKKDFELAGGNAKDLEMKARAA